MLRQVALSCCLVCGRHGQVAKQELRLECDYTLERHAQERFAQLLASEPELLGDDHFNVPATVPELSTDNVLTSEWVEGVHIDKVGAVISSLPRTLCG